MGLLGLNITLGDPAPPALLLELFLLLEEHRKADDSAVDQEAADDGHYHGWERDRAAVGKDKRKR